VSKAQAGGTQLCARTAGDRSFGLNKGEMNKAKLLTAVFALLAACAYKLPEAQVLKIFERHSFKEHDPEKLRILLREKGLAGLKSEDKYAEVMVAGRKDRLPLIKPEPSTGMLVGAKGGVYFLLRVFKGSPAEAAGLREGDKLLAVNSAVPGSEEFFKILEGRPEFKVKVSRRSKDGFSESEAEVKGGEFYAPAVFGLYDPESRSAFLRVGLFFDKSASMAEAGLASLEKIGAKGIVFDLRGNRGGSPLEAAALLNLFAPKAGTVFALASRHKGYTRLFEAPARGRFAGMRAVVLTDAATAAAGEVFAASLKEISGAQVVGGRTAGSVSIQKSFSLGGGRGLRLTVARLVPPSGADLEGAGLVPDVPVAAAATPAWAAVPADVLLKDPAYRRALELLAKAK